MRQIILTISLFVSVGLVCGQNDIDVRPSSHDFGSLYIGESATITVTISNVGNKPIGIYGIAFRDSSSSDYVASGYSVPVFFSAGGSYDFEVTFTASAAKRSIATLQISSSDLDEPVVDVLLVGQGIEKKITLENQIKAIIELSQISIEDGTLVGKGPGKSAEHRLQAFKNMLRSAEDMILNGFVKTAYTQLESIYTHMDGEPKPDDFVEGKALIELRKMMMSLMKSMVPNP